MDYTQRSTNLDLLHPAMRASAVELLAATERLGVKFIIWEAYRHPERQDYLYRTKTKTRSGKWIRRTRARAWTSYHQYGVACDFVLDMPGHGKWANSKPEHKAWWNVLHGNGELVGLRPLGFEKPHMQMQHASLKDFRAGLWLSGADDPYVYNLRQAIARHKSWRKPKRLPPYEDDDDRPMDCDGLDEDG